MPRRGPVYGLDIELDGRHLVLVTDDHGASHVDPRSSSVLAVALSHDGFDEVFAGFEPDVLADVDERLRGLEPGVIATWGGGAFDLPFLAERAARWRVPLGLELRRDPGVRPAPVPVAGHPGAYRATWYDHVHVDTRRLGRGASVRGALAAAGRLIGIGPADRRRDLDPRTELGHASARCDAHLARALAERRRSALARVADHPVRTPARSA